MKHIEYIVGHLTDAMVADLKRRGCQSIKFAFWSKAGTPVHVGVMKCYAPEKSSALAA